MKNLLWETHLNVQANELARKVYQSTTTKQCREEFNFYPIFKAYILINNTDIAMQYSREIRTDWYDPSLKEYPMIQFKWKEITYNGIAWDTTANPLNLTDFYICYFVVTLIQKYMPVMAAKYIRAKN
eukprot:13549680-Ditylum_brightwellii.AAC.1